MRAISSDRRSSLAKQVQELYDVCSLAGSFCSHSSDCVGILNLSSFYLPSTSFGDDRAIQNAIHKIKNCSDFFASECIALIRQAADWSISFAAGSDARKNAFLKDVSQGKGREFLRDVLNAYDSGNETDGPRGNCGYSIGSREYRNYMERKAFLQDLPAMSGDDYDGALRDALTSIANQLQRDLARNERENNYITDETARKLHDAASELGHCGISVGLADSAIDRLDWFVGGDPDKIRRLQSKLNELGVGQRLEEDGVFGVKTLGTFLSFINRLENGAVPTLKWVDPLKNNRRPLQIGSGLDGANNVIQDAEITREFTRGKQTHTENFPYFRIDPPRQRASGTYAWGNYRGKMRRIDYNHINIEFGDNPTRVQNFLVKHYNHYPLDDIAYNAIKDLQDFGKKVRVAGRRLLIAGVALDALELGLAIIADLNDGDKKLGKTSLSSAVSIGGRWAGATAGAKLGALAGGLTGPAAPVAVPVLSLVGGIAGSFGGDALGQWL